MRFQRVAILGAGAWGCALACAIARAGRQVSLWARDPAAVAAMRTRAESPRLPGVRLADGITFHDDLATALDADAVLLAAPAQALRSLATQAAPLLSGGLPVVACAKGIERGSGRFMTEIIAEAMPSALPAILSGPSFADDVARGLPTAVTLAAHDADVARDLAAALGSTTFRPYHSADVRGVEIGGAAKNVLAVAAGIVAGRGLGASAGAALTTRGFAELMRFGRALGAEPATLTGLSGLGDLLLSCSTAQSRNYALGVALGRGAVPDNAKLAEGAFTAPALLAMAKAHGVDMPIATAAAAVLDGAWTVEEALEALLARPFKAETGE